MDDSGLSNRRDAFVPSLVTAFGVLVYLVVSTTLLIFAGQLIHLAGIPAEEFLIELAQTGVTEAAFAAACLICFWLLAPITPLLSIGKVIARAAVASGVAFVLLVPIQFAILSSMYADVGPTQSGGLYDLVELSAPEPDLLRYAIQNSLYAAVSRLPVIALAAFALWWWLRRIPTSTSEGTSRSKL